MISSRSDPELPRFHEDERLAVGAMLSDPDLARRVAAELEPEAFLDQTLRQVFLAIKAVLRDLSTGFCEGDVIAALERRGVRSPATVTAELIDGAVPAMLTPACLARLQEAAARRDAVTRLGVLREACFDIGRDVGEIQNGLDEVAAAFRTVDATDPLRSTPWASDLPAESLPPQIVQSLLVVGEPGKAGGTLALISGDRGLGKSWWSLAAAHRITNGQPIGRLPTECHPVAVLLLESERWESISRRDAIDPNARVWQQVMVWDKRDLFSDPAHPFSLLDPVWQERLTRNIRERGIRLLIIDPLGKALRGEASLLDERDATRACAVLEAIAFATGCAILLVAHKPKQQALGPSKRTAFGSYIWESSPRTVGSFDEDRGAICLSWQKAHAGPLPASTWYKAGTWPLEETAEPQDARRAKDERLEYLLELQKDGIQRTPKELAQALEDEGFKPVQPDTVRRRYLPALNRQAPRIPPSPTPDTESRPGSVRESTQPGLNQ